MSNVITIKPTSPNAQNYKFTDVVDSIFRASTVMDIAPRVRFAKIDGVGTLILDTEARVERIVEYKVKGAEVAAGKEVCAVNDGYGYNRFFHALPECGEGKTRAEFSKSRTIIHIPAGSMDKMVVMTSE